MIFDSRFALPLMLGLLTACNSNAPQDDATTEASTPPDAVQAFDRPQVQSVLRSTFPEADTKFVTKSVDLDGDGAEEVLAYAYGPSICGSGGCALLVLTPDGAAYRKMAQTSVTQAPVKVLRTETSGWRDLSVGVSGGGAEAKQVRLRFDGSTYPENPTVLPEGDVVDVSAGTPLVEEPLDGRVLPNEG